MLRQSAFKLIRVNSPIAARSFSMSAVRAAEGDTGSPRFGGQAAGDAFTRREESEELRYVKEQERQKLLNLKKKLADQRKHLDELDKHIDELTKGQGQ